MINRVHDVGGTASDALIEVSADYAPFAYDWQATVHGIMMEVEEPWPLDWARHVRELSVPEAYRSDPYYVSWAMTYAVLLIDAGILTREEIETGASGTKSAARSLTAEEAICENRARAADVTREAVSPPAFATGDAVRTGCAPPPGHTRLPTYAAGARGRVIAHHGAHVLPDASARGVEQAGHLYSVAFDAGDLFDGSSERGHRVILDLWEDYLECADT